MLVCAGRSSQHVRRPEDTAELDLALHRATMQVFCSGRSVVS